MNANIPQFEARLAQSESEIRAAQRLRYEVFVAELGGGGDLVDHDARLERDRYDPQCEHLLLFDHARGGEVVAVYRLMTGEAARAGAGFYCAAEYDLTPIESSGRRLLEIGRSCLHADYRGGAAMAHLWMALSAFVEERGTEIVFGVASFHGTDVQALAEPLSYLNHSHLAPEELRVRSRAFQSMDLMPPEKIDRKAAMVATPALMKAYLRLGGFVGDGAFVDHDFNTTDVFVMMDTRAMNDRQRGLYTKARP
jgi:putative hemolysin